MGCGSAKFVVVDQRFYHVCAAGRTLRILSNFNCTECHCQRVDSQQPSDQCVSQAKQHLYRLCRLNGTDEAGHDSENAALGAARYQLGRGRLAKETAVARTIRGAKNRCLPLEPIHAAVDVWNPEQHRGVVDQVAGREIIGAVDYQVIATGHLERICGGKSSGVWLDMNVRIDVAQAIDGGVELGTTYSRRPVQNLAMQVGQIDRIEIDQADRPNSRGCEIQRDRRAKAAGANKQRARVLERTLAFLANLRQENVPTVPHQLFASQLRRVAARLGVCVHGILRTESMSLPL